MWTGASICGWQISLAAVTLHNHILGVSHTLIVCLSNFKGCVCTALKPASVCYFRGAARSHPSFQAEGALSTTSWGIVLLRYDQNRWVFLSFSVLFSVQQRDRLRVEWKCEFRLFKYDREQIFSWDHLFLCLLLDFLLFPSSIARIFRIWTLWCLIYRNMSIKATMKEYKNGDSDSFSENPPLSRCHVVPKMADGDHIVDGSGCVRLSRRL